MCVGSFLLSRAVQEITTLRQSQSGVGVYIMNFLFGIFRRRVDISELRRISEAYHLDMIAQSKSRLAAFAEKEITRAIEGLIPKLRNAAKYGWKSYDVITLAQYSESSVPISPPKIEDFAPRYKRVWKYCVDQGLEPQIVV